MISALSEAKCFKHVDREAVAKCPECGRFFCRECVTEHEGRVVCRSCLDSLLEGEPQNRRSWLHTAGSWALTLAGYVIVFYGFYLIGRLLLRIPSEFHSGDFFE